LKELGQGSESVLTGLLGLLQDPESDVRGRAASVLGTLGQGSEAVLTGLLGLLQDPESDVRGRAASALGKLGQGSESVRSALGQWLSQQPAEAKLGEAIDALGTLMDGA
jgi:HEAT repeat protein